MKPLETGNIRPVVVLDLGRLLADKEVKDFAKKLYVKILTTYELTSTYEEAKAAAFETFNAFQHMFIGCAMSTMPDQHYKSGELKTFVNYPPKTTIGLSPKFSSNRKYFANLISTLAFKTMLANDQEEIRRDMVRKLKYCDKVIMDVNVLKDFYDREIDLTKI